MGSDLSLATGDAFDVKVKPVVEKRERLGLFRWRTTMHYTLTNALPRGVTVDLLQDGLWGDTRIVSESAKSERQSADVAKWRVSVPANGSRSEEHTSELQSLMRISYAVFCLK